MASKLSPEVLDSVELVPSDPGFQVLCISDLTQGLFTFQLDFIYFLSNSFEVVEELLVFLLPDGLLYLADDQPLSLLTTGFNELAFCEIPALFCRNKYFLFIAEPLLPFAHLITTFLH